ncbi:MAG: hypothetical protein RR672_12855 [Raoultibacter sp.]
MLDGLLIVANFALLLSISWDTYSTKKRVADLYNRNPGKILECPYGYGLCHTLPFGHKPFECEECATQQQAEATARSGNNE